MLSKRSRLNDRIVLHRRAADGQFDGNARRDSASMSKKEVRKF